MHMVRNSNSRGGVSLPYTLLQVLQGRSLEATTVTSFLNNLPEIVHMYVCAHACRKRKNAPFLLHE